MSCNKGSDSHDEYSNGTIEDPRFHGSMEAKINGQLKIWRAAHASVLTYCDLFGCVSADCFHSIVSLGLYEPDSVTVGINFNISDPEKYGCNMNAWYTASDYTVPDTQVHYSTRDLCEDDDPRTTTTYICNDWSFDMTPVGNDIYRGTFSFVATRNCGQDSVVITDGKFEIKSEKPPCN